MPINFPGALTVLCAAVLPEGDEYIHTSATPIFCAYVAAVTRRLGPRRVSDLARPPSLSAALRQVSSGFSSQSASPLHSTMPCRYVIYLWYISFGILICMCMIIYLHFCVPATRVHHYFFNLFFLYWCVFTMIYNFVGFLLFLLWIRYWYITIYHFGDILITMPFLWL